LKRKVEIIMSAINFRELAAHCGHELEIVLYGSPPINVAIECMTCCEVLVDYEDDEGEEDENNTNEEEEHGK